MTIIPSRVTNENINNQSEGNFISTRDIIGGANECQSAGKVNNITNNAIQEQQESYKVNAVRNISYFIDQNRSQTVNNNSIYKIGDGFNDANNALKNDDLISHNMQLNQYRVYKITKGDNNNELTTNDELMGNDTHSFTQGNTKK